MKISEVMWQNLQLSKRQFSVSMNTAVFFALRIALLFKPRTVARQQQVMPFEEQLKRDPRARGEKEGRAAGAE